MPMTAKQFEKITRGITTAFPWANLFPNPDAVEIWYRKLGDIPYDVMAAVVNRWIETKTQPPTIAALRQEADIVVNGVPPTWADGWEQVQKAIGRFGYMQREAALASMDEVTQETVKRIGWQQICESENVDALRANFRMVYETLSRRAQESRMISAGTQEKLSAVRTVPQIAALSEKMKLTDRLTERIDPNDRSRDPLQSNSPDLVSTDAGSGESEGNAETAPHAE